MSDYIKREDAIEIIARHDDTDGTIKVFSGRFVNGLISAIPPADVRENVRATKLVMTWFGNPLKNPNVTNYYICSNCHMPVDEWDKFCKHCGADIRGDNNGKSNEQ